MPDLTFQIRGALGPVAQRLRHRICSSRSQPPRRRAHSDRRLRCQIQIETPRRRYTAGEQARLRDLFRGARAMGPDRPCAALDQPHRAVPAFAGTTRIELPFPCTFDFNVTPRSISTVSTAARFRMT